MTLTYIHCLDLPPGVPDRWPASLCLQASDDRVLTAAHCSTAEQVYPVLPHFSHMVLYSCMEAGSLVKICIKGSGSTEEDAVTLEGSGWGKEICESFLEERCLCSASTN